MNFIVWKEGRGSLSDLPPLKQWTWVPILTRDFFNLCPNFNLKFTLRPVVKDNIVRISAKQFDGDDDFNSYCARM